MGHVGQVAHRPLGRHPRGDTARQQRQQRFHHGALQTRTAMAVVGDGAADDGAGLLISQHRTDATGVAEQGVARHRGELLGTQQHVAEGAEAGADAVGALAPLDDALDDAAGIVDARPGGVRQFQGRPVTRHRHHLAPVQWRIAQQDFLG
ncbi:hypothetical protein FQZ97_997830 [compost metagenome]